MDSITQNDLEKLSTEELISRMDDILLKSSYERYSYLPKDFPRQEIPLVSQLIKTSRLSILADDVKREIANIAFDYLVQLELNSVGAGIFNIITSIHGHSNQELWLSPLFRLRQGVIYQYIVAFSRVAMEIFMDLLYFVEKGKRLKTRQKLQTFRDWLGDTEHPLHYFAYILLTVYKFDKDLRTDEIHGTPQFPRKLLLLQKPTSEEQNMHYQLFGELINCWRPLIDILNGRKPTYMTISSDKAQEWFKAFISGAKEEIDMQLQDMFSYIDSQKMHRA